MIVYPILGPETGLVTKARAALKKLRRKIYRGPNAASDICSFPSRKPVSTIDRKPSVALLRRLTVVEAGELVLGYMMLESSLTGGK